jgi:dihydroorotate dehydrogenase (NAD+) catalytic subunit
MESVKSIKSVDLSTTIGSMKLKNPVMTASGTFGYGKEFRHLVNLDTIGAIIVKGISYEPRPGNPPPRVFETPCGMLNAIGLENVGVEKFISEKLPFLREIGSTNIVNILGDSIDDYARLANRLSGISGIDALEVNISCPNVKKGGVAFGTIPDMAAAVTRSVKEATDLPVIVKLSPNVTDVTEIALAVEHGGADAVSLINTLIGMAIDIRSKKPRLANIIGGLSGPAVRPVALRMVWQVAQKVSIPVIGIGGIDCAENALEFFLAGASAVQIGTANFYDPSATEKIVSGIKKYLLEQGLSSIVDIIGKVQIE